MKMQISNNKNHREHLLGAILIFGACYIFSSCNLIYGIHPQHVVDHDKIKKFYESNLYNNVGRGLISSAFVNYIKRTYNDPKMRNEHLQPIQAYYFINKKWVAYYINCNAGGFPNLDWNRNNSFATFPPITQTPVDSILSMDSLVNNGVDMLPHNSDVGNNCVIVFWNLLLEKQSKRLIDLVVENAKKSTVPFHVLLVNNDSLFLEK